MVKKTAVLALVTASFAMAPPAQAEPGPSGPARTDHCVSRSEWNRTPYSDTLTRHNLRMRWGVAGFTDKQHPQHGVIFPKCGVALRKGLIWVRFDKGYATVMETQRDLDSPPSDWLLTG